MLVGAVAGLGSVVFSIGLTLTTEWMMVRGAGYVQPAPGAQGGAAAQLPTRPWGIILMPALGGLLAGLLIYTFAPEAEGHGTDAVIDAYHRKAGFIRNRVPFVKTIASILTIGSGGSAGREGPIGQIGAGFASALCGWLKTSDAERRVLMLSGAGAGIGAIFRAPLGGALFICEVLYRDSELESRALLPAFVATIVAYTVQCSIIGVWGPIFTVRELSYSGLLELPLYLLLGVACAILGTFYVKVFYGLRDYLFRPIRLPNHVKPAIGGLLVGVIGLFLPQALGMGYGWAQLMIEGSLSLRLVAAILIVKIFTTGLTIGSGGSGGVFAPSIVIGGCTGFVVGTLLNRMSPDLVDPAAFVLVGMGGFFAGVAKTPLASLVMVCELTGGYNLLAPLMLACVVAYLLAPRTVSIYEKQVNSSADSPAHADGSP